MQIIVPSLSLNERGARELTVGEAERESSSNVVSHALKCFGNIVHSKFTKKSKVIVKVLPAT